MNKIKILEVISSQYAEIKEFIMKGAIPRDVVSDVPLLLETPWIKVIIGIRRCGKSVFAHQLLEKVKYGYINFDDERLAGLLRKDLQTVFEALLEFYPDTKKFLFDEIQNVEGWELFVNRLQRSGYNIVITGSNSGLLSRELSSHLTGRFVQTELFPFSFREHLRFFKLEEQYSELQRLTPELKASLVNQLNTYFQQGGFPEILRQGFQPLYLRDLYSSVIVRDVAMRYKIRNPQDLKQMALHCYENPGTRFSYQKIARVFGYTSVVTVKKYIQYLEECYLVYQLHPFSFKTTDRVKLPRKIYPIDLGMLAAISSKAGQSLGAKLETMVLLQLRRQKKEVFYYHGADNEVDFVVKSGRTVEQLIQVCYTLHDEKTRKREVVGLQIASRQLKCTSCLIITWDEGDDFEIEQMGIKVVPVWKWLLTGE